MSDKFCRRNNIMFVFLIVLLLILTSCGSKKNNSGSDTAAIVNGEEISIKTIEQKIASQNVAIKMQQQINNLLIEKSINDAAAQSGNSVEQFFRSQGFDLTSLSMDEDRFYQRMKRNQERMSRELTMNEAFNLIITDEVLYQEAQQKGFKISTEEAQKRLDQIEKGNLQMWEEMGITDEVKSIEENSAKELGFISREEQIKAGIPDYLKKAAITQLKDWFTKRLGEKYPDVQGFDFQIVKENAWEDYTEQLLHNADIEIKLQGLEVNYYGEQFPEDYFQEKPETGETNPLIKQQASFTFDGEYSKEELSATADILEQRLKKTGVNDFVVAIGEKGLKVQEAYWDKTIPWEQLAAKGVLQIGDGDLILTNRHLQTAKASEEKRNNVPSSSLTIEFNTEGTELLASMTENNIGKKLPIYLDGEIISSPIVRQAITGESVMITPGNSNKFELNSLAAVLSAGPLPVDLKFVGE